MSRWLGDFVDQLDINTPRWTKEKKRMQKQVGFDDQKGKKKLQSLWMKCMARWWFHFFYFDPYLGKWSNLTNIFQMGWHHQLDRDSKSICIYPYTIPMKVFLLNTMPYM